MNANKGTAEERGALGNTKGKKRPGCEYVQQMKKEQCERTGVQSTGIKVKTGRGALVLTT